MGLSILLMTSDYSKLLSAWSLNLSCQSWVDAHPDCLTSGKRSKDQLFGGTHTSIKSYSSSIPRGFLSCDSGLVQSMLLMERLDGSQIILIPAARLRAEEK